MTNLTTRIKVPVFCYITLDEVGNNDSDKHLLVMNATASIRT